MYYQLASASTYRPRRSRILLRLRADALLRRLSRVAAAEMHPAGLLVAHLRPFPSRFGSQLALYFRPALVQGAPVAISGLGLLHLRQEVQAVASLVLRLSIFRR